MILRPFAFLLVGACLDYDLLGDEDAPEGDAREDETTTPSSDDDSACDFDDVPPEAVAASDVCDYEVSGFEPVVKWEAEGASTALPVVADLDRDGMPEIIVNSSGLFGTGELTAYRGDDGTPLWETRGAEAGYGAHPAVADIDGDGSPEVLVVREYSSSMWGTGEYSVIMLDAEGQEIGESDTYTDDEFDYATGIVVSDMDHDGSPEIVAGRVILNADLSERAVGRYGRGCPAYAGIGLYGEGANPGVADLDLDGVEEVITGDSMFSPDGDELWHSREYDDAAVVIANLDDDPEGEFVAASFNVVRAHDTNGDTLWELTSRSANILSSPAVGDVDNDGYPEIIVAGGDELWVLRRDGSELWTYRVHDMSGATGAALFDFDADGILEIVYIDEIQMIAFNGKDGTVKFQTDEHSSATMYDYPVIADVDADGHADIVVVHDISYSVGVTVFEDANNSWAPARDVWNQHHYTITNINDDLSVPADPVQNFTVYNSFHSALPLPPGESLGDELDGEILDICRDDCDRGLLWVSARVRNTGNGEIPAGVLVSLYAEDVLVGTEALPAAVPAETTSEAILFEVDATLVEGADSLVISVDDDGTGTGIVTECLEDNNRTSYDDALCD